MPIPLPTNTGSSAARVIKRNSRLFLSKHRHDRRVSIHLDNDYCVQLGVQPGDLVVAQRIPIDQTCELLIRKAKERGVQFRTKSNGWGAMTVKLDEDLISRLFTRGENIYIPSDVRTTEAGRVRIILADKPTEAVPASVQADTIHSSSEAKGEPHPLDGASSTLTPSIVKPDQARPRRLRASGYTGVAQAPQSGRWTAIVYFQGRAISAGTYTSRHEAAHAFNLAEGILYGEDARPNDIPGEEQPSPDRKAAITATVELRLRLADALSGPVRDRSRVSKSSGYRGVRWHRASRRWNAAIYHHDKKLSLRYYKTKHLAALAYNYASQILYPGENLLNNVEHADLPPDTDKTALRDRVISKLREYGVEITDPQS